MRLISKKHVIRNSCTVFVFKRDFTFVLKDRGYWMKKENQRQCLDEAGKKLNVKKMDDWYNVSYNDLKKYAGERLLQIYDRSPSKAIMSVYDEYQWIPWKFENQPRKFWDNPQNMRKFMNWAASQLNITKTTDWLHVTAKTIDDLGGRSLLERFKAKNNTMANLLAAAFPKEDWSRRSGTYWSSIYNQRKFFDEIATKLNIKEPSDWYEISTQQIKEHNGGFILAKYKNSPYNLLRSLYPEFSWKPWLFNKSRLFWRNFTTDPKLQTELIQWLATEFKIDDPRDWELISYERIRKKVGNIPMKSLEFMSIVKQYFPNLNLDAFKNVKLKKTQANLYSVLHYVFPSEEILEEYKHPDLVFPNGESFELDFYIPAHKLAFEYQGEQHYKNSTMFQHLSLEERRKYDRVKLEICANKGITLIEIPYWWKRDPASLIATIHKMRPEIFSPQFVPGSEPIPIIEPVKTVSLKKVTICTLATIWDESKDPTGWWMSEKYDGVRGFWDGEKMKTRGGRELEVPSFFVEKLPKAKLDGELWVKYGLPQAAATLCKTTSESVWKNAVFMVFDAPNKDVPFELRMESLYALAKNFPDHVKVVDMVKCEGKEHLEKFYNQVIAKKGEGVMLREPESLFQVGRSPTLQKYKKYLDTEVRVLENKYPHGLECEQTNDTRVFVTITENSEEAKLLKPGDVVTVKYSGVNIHDKLIQPTFFRIREDLSWNSIKFDV